MGVNSVNPCRQGGVWTDGRPCHNMRKTKVALDWHIVGPNGELEATVPLEENAHAELFARAGLHRPHHGQGRYPGGGPAPRSSGQPTPGPVPLPPLPLLARATDYYADVSYSPEEVPRLLVELTAVAPRCGGAADQVAALAALCEEAMHRRRGIVALAD
jgi:hypothetical protein